MITRRVAPILFAACLVGTVALSGCASMSGLSPARHTLKEAEDPLPGWSDTEEKRAILHFVAQVTRPEGPHFIPPQDRLATFDFDGTIGCEKPDYMEVFVAMSRLCKLTKDTPNLLKESLYRAACDGDLKTIHAKVEDVLLKAFAGESQSFYVDYVENFLRTDRHPRFDRPYAQLYYLPMQQLIDFLRAQQFTVYIVSGSQQGFTRSYGSNILGFPAAHLIGHTVELEFSMTGESPALLRQDSFLPPSIDGKGKVEIIQNRIGRQPILAFGNSMGDFEMLQYATSHEYLSLGLILVHDDPAEYVYRDETLIQHAEELGWQVISMKDNFEVIFSYGEPVAH